MKIIFFGSDDFAAAHFESLIGSTHDLLACVTRPDRPKGRGMKIVISPIKECAQKHNIPVLQPANLNDPAFISGLKQFQSDIFVVIAYGKLLPKNVLNIPLSGAINVHGSLLPKYRGAAPINWAIINGDKETGISIIKMAEQIDAGDVIAAKKIKIDNNETSVTLRAKMIKEGPSFLLQSINDLSKNQPVVQDRNLVTFAPKLTKELGHIQWTKTAEEIHNLVKGLLPWPTAYTYYKGKMMKMLESQIVNQDFSEYKPGTVIKVDKEGIIVSTKSGGLLIKKVHFQDSKPMTAHDFVIGHAFEEGKTCLN